MGVYTLKLTLAEPGYLKDSISIISELVTEASFKITKDGIELIAMDPANVAMVIFKMFSSSFLEYSVDKNIDLAINLNNLKQILKRAKPTDTLVLETTQDKLILQFKGESVRTFSIPIIDLDEREQKIPSLSFMAKVNTNSSTLNEAIDDSDIVAESVTFMAEKGKMTVLAQGDSSKAQIDISENDLTKVEVLGSGESVKARYSIEYLKKMISAGKISGNVVVQFSGDYPLRLDYIVVDRLLLSFILAPRVED